MQLKITDNCTYCIQEVDTIEGGIGFCVPVTHSILIAKCTEEGVKVDEQCKLETLLHEINHAIFTALGCSELNENESLLDGLSTLQASVLRANFGVTYSKIINHLTKE
jgi:hypothetical protein